MIYYLGSGFPGARNDKTVVMSDTFMHLLKTDPRYVEYEYEVYGENGERHTMKGLHSLCDGGYHRWVTTICGYKHPEDYAMKAWSKLCESTRKDVECVFGILKKRFRILKCPFLEFEPDAIDCTVRACAILQNMVTKDSGLSDIGTEEAHWRKVDAVEAGRFGLDLDNIDTVVIGRQGVHDEVTLEDAGFENKRRMIVKHYACALAAGEVEKMKTAAQVLMELDEIEGDEGIEVI